MQGVVDSIYIAGAAQEPMRMVSTIRAVSGKGLEGDRYFLQLGTYSDRPGPRREVTLIEFEAIEAVSRDYGVPLLPGESRRNIVTRGVSLNHLVDREFRIGEVVLKGLRLCEPCSHLESLSHKGVLASLIHRGGLRAQVIREGTIRIGDPVEELPRRSQT